MAEGKTCTKCKEFKGYFLYHKRSDSKDGYKSSCKTCRNKKSEIRRAKLKDTRKEEYLKNLESKKRCEKCHIDKLVKDFHFELHGQMGTSTYCKICSNNGNKKRYHQKYKNSEQYKNKKSKYGEKYWKELVSDDKREILKEKTRVWRSENSERVKAYNKEYKKENKGLCRYIAQKRRKQSEFATPSWIKESDMIKIWDSCPEGCEVDHIIPLCHPDVCGLNVPWNFQYLEARLNRSKNNKFDYTLENESWRTEVRINK